MKFSYKPEITTGADMDALARVCSCLQKVVYCKLLWAKIDYSSCKLQLDSRQLRLIWVGVVWLSKTLLIVLRLNLKANQVAIGEERQWPARQPTNALHPSKKEDKAKEIKFVNGIPVCLDTWKTTGSCRDEVWGSQVGIACIEGQVGVWVCQNNFVAKVSGP